MTFPRGRDPQAPPTDLDRLRVALAVELALGIADADGVLDIAEVELLGRAFPDRWMARCGFLDAEGQLNPTWARYRDRARTELAQRLSLDQKLELLTLLHQTCLADGELHPRELERLAEAARRLKIPKQVFREHLGRLRTGAAGAPPPVREG